ncbi:matrixin family metalloprotease [Paracoccus sp. M683]|uniref:matrixin family metalloprotease n=1 Tax=Paracoccus sp. M683 TaxID=2594268 RepID=UPI001C8F9173|nr:matrixin family metalloprotease [Paracoccus sp. M683]
MSDFTALTTGQSRWNATDKLGTGTVVTYTFLDSGELPSLWEHPAAVPYYSNRYVSMDSSQRAAVNRALNEYGSKSGLHFVEVDDPANASVQILANQTGDPNMTSWAYFPETSSFDGDVYLNSVYVTMSYSASQSWSQDWSRGSSIYTVLVHEIGHSIGLEHPHDGIDNKLLDPQFDSHYYTIMSYNWQWAGWDSGRSRDTLATLDLQAIRYLYGADQGFAASWRSGGQFLAITGGAGNDQIATGRAPSLMQGGLGNDRLTGAQFNDTLEGGDGADQLDGGAGNDRIVGGNGRDVLLGGGGDDLLAGGVGDDRMMGEVGMDRLFGASGNDQMDGGAGGDRMLGEDGNDILKGRAGFDSLYGGKGGDKLSGDGGSDQLFGDYGGDRLDGGDGNDQLNGGLGIDRLLGGLGNDLLFGGGGNDTLQAGAGRDTLNGGTGEDLLTGGAGADVFVFRGPVGTDRILDWQDGIDRISLEGRNGFDSFADVAALAVQRGNDVAIVLNANSTIIIEDTLLAQLDAGDFIL